MNRERKRCLQHWESGQRGFIVWQGQLQRANSVSLCLLWCLFSISDYDVTLTFREKGIVLHGSDKLPSKKHFPNASSTSYQEDKTMIVSLNSGLRKKTPMTQMISKCHWKMVFASITESNVDSVCVKMDVHVNLYMHVQYYMYFVPHQNTYKFCN